MKKTKEKPAILETAKQDSKSTRVDNCASCAGSKFC